MTKAANCLVPDASTRGGWLFRRVMGLMRRRMGGLWVGGRVTLTSTRLRFTPNAVNAAMHDGDTSQSVELCDVTAVEDRPGVFTKIVRVDAPGGGVTFRCYGARKMSQRIRDAVAASR